MDMEKITADVGTVGMGVGGLALWHYTEVGLGIFMLFGGACLLAFRFYLAFKENKLLNIELKKAERETGI